MTGLVGELDRVLIVAETVFGSLCITLTILFLGATLWLASRLAGAAWRFDPTTGFGLGYLPLVLTSCVTFQLDQPLRRTFWPLYIAAVVLFAGAPFISRRRTIAALMELVREAIGAWRYLLAFLTLAAFVTAFSFRALKQGDLPVISH